MAAIHHNTLKKAKVHKIELTVEDGEVVASQNGVRLASHLSGTVALQAALNRLGGDHVQEIKPVEFKSVKTGKPAKAPKAKKSSGPHENAARAEGWTSVKGGGYKQAGVDDEDGGTSDAASWRDLCEEQDIEVEQDEGRSIVKAKYRALYRPHHNTNGDDLSQQLRDYLLIDDEDGKRIDGDKLVRFAKANDCWVESYASLRTASGSVNLGQQRMNVGNRLRAKLRKDPEYAVKWPK